MPFNDFPIGATRSALVFPIGIEIRARNKRDTGITGVSAGQNRRTHPELRLSHEEPKSFAVKNLLASEKFFLSVSP
jgi:hypothetical protein